MKRLEIKIVSLNKTWVVGFTIKRFIDSIYTSLKIHTKRKWKKETLKNPLLYESAFYEITRIKKPYYGLQVLITGSKELIEDQYKEWEYEWEKIIKNKSANKAYDILMLQGINFSCVRLDDELSREETPKSKK